MNNYEIISTEFVEEINSDVTIYSHKKTKARVCVMKNTDKNKVFSIAFRTPPIDSTGLTHILEHSVLCGSKKYPVKDPFVELIKGSLNTFLNAFTFPDKTMYPVASMNNKDFNNLMNVYMDAVFFPNIYTHKEIFMQEGWHYDIGDKNDDIKYNGVVYNEMKGAFSNPEQVLNRNIMHSLFPNTAYGLESGGDPKEIPNLTYDKFLEFHHKYYHPSNSYIFLYGDMDVEERLEFLDSEYLSKFTYLEFDTTIKHEKPFKEPVELCDYYPIGNEEDTLNKTYLSYNTVLGDTLDVKRSIAYEILTDVLFNSPGAPIKDAIIKSGICEDVDAGFESGILETYLSVIARGANEDKLNELKNIIEDNLKNIKLDKEAIMAQINFNEFKVREAKFDYPAGLLYQMMCLDSYLYDDSKPLDKLKVLNVYSELKKLIDSDFYDNLVKEIIESTHKSYVALIPSKSIGKSREDDLNKKLNDFKNSLSYEEIDELILDKKNLEKYQEEPSDREAISSLPKLLLSDIERDPIKYNCEEINGDFKTLYSNYFTNGICYLSLDFDVKDVEDTEALAILNSLLFLMSTEKYSYNDINKLIKVLSGGIYSTMKLNQKLNSSDYDLKLAIKLSCKEENLKTNLELVKEVISNSIFDNERLSEIINQVKNNVNQAISGSGHQAALSRAKSYLSIPSLVRDKISGISFMDSINKIAKETSKESLISRIKHIVSIVFSKDRFSLGITADNSNDIIKEVKDTLYDFLSDSKIKENFKPTLEILNEGFKAPFNVNYVARAGHLDEIDGSAFVLKNAISLDYLWDRVRVHGGAYGCMISLGLDGALGLTSYRDPNIKRTNDCYLNLPEFINNLDIDDETILKYKIGAISSFDQPLHASSMGEKAQSQYLSNISYSYCMKIRHELLDTKASDLRKYGALFSKALDSSSICAIGNEKLVEDDKDLFKNVRNLIK